MLWRHGSLLTVRHGFGILGALAIDRLLLMLAALHVDNFLQLLLPWTAPFRVGSYSGRLLFSTTAFHYNYFLVLLLPSKTALPDCLICAAAFRDGCFSGRLLHTAVAFQGGFIQDFFLWATADFDNNFFPVRLLSMGFLSMGCFGILRLQFFRHYLRPSFHAFLFNTALFIIVAL